MRSRKPVAGDVYGIPVDDERYAVAHLINLLEGLSPFLAVHRELVRIDKIGDDLDSAISSEIILQGFTFDAFIKNGKWPHLGTAEIDKQFKFPAYREGGGPTAARIVDYSGIRARIATPAEVQATHLRTFHGVLGFEDAIKARFGLMDWRSDYDSLVPGGLTTVDAFGA